MRSVRLSRTFLDQFHELLAQGVPRVGQRVVAVKQARVYNSIEHHLALFPGIGTLDPRLGLRTYPISQTPFVLIYDFDDREVRVHFIIHGRADRSRLEPDDVEW